MMRTEEPRPVRLSEYRPPDWLVETVDLDVKLHPTQTPVRATLKLKPNPAAGAPAPLMLDGDGLTLVSLKIDGAPVAADALCRDAGRPHHRAAAAPAVHAGDRDAGRSAGQHAALRALPVERQLLHPVRGRRLPPHHLFSGPARRDGGLHHAHRGRQSRSAGAARQRQSARERRPARRPAFRGLARSVAEARLSVRAGRRQARPHRGQLRHRVGPQGRAPHLCRARQGRPRRLRDGFAQALHALGRAGVRPRIRSRHVHDRRGVRLQHGRDGEQGPQRLQRQIRAGLARRPRPTTTSSRSKPSSRTSISTTGPATASPAATGSSSA